MTAIPSHWMDVEPMYRTAWGVIDRPCFYCDAKRTKAHCGADRYRCYSCAREWTGMDEVEAR